MRVARGDRLRQLLPRLCPQGLDRGVLPRPRGVPLRAVLPGLDQCLDLVRVVRDPRLDRLGVFVLGSEILQHLRDLVRHPRRLVRRHGLRLRSRDGSAAADAQRLTADALASGVSASPPLRYALQAVHGAAVFDLGDRADGLAEMQRARTEFGDHHTSPQHCASMATLEFRGALRLGHVAAARTVLGWLTDRIGDRGDLLVMRGWAETAGGHHEHARTLIRPVLDGSAAVLLPVSVVDAWLLETSIAVAAGERPAARRALQNALALAEPLDAPRPFVQAGPGVRELLVHHHGSFGASDDFAHRALAAGPARETQQALLSERELTVLGLLPSMLSLDEIAADLTVSVNTVKSHVRSIYAKLGVSSRRLAGSPPTNTASSTAHVDPGGGDSLEYATGGIAVPRARRGRPARGRQWRTRPSTSAVVAPRPCSVWPSDPAATDQVVVSRPWRRRSECLTLGCTHPAEASGDRGRI